MVVLLSWATEAESKSSVQTFLVATLFSIVYSSTNIALPIYMHFLNNKYAVMLYTFTILASCSVMYQFANINMAT